MPIRPNPLKTLLFTISILLSFSLQAQEQRIPTNEKEGTAEYVEVIAVNNTSAKQMQSFALGWMNEFYNNPSRVIQSVDSNSLEINGKARFRLTTTDKKGNTSPAGFVAYNITLQFKEGRFRYLIDHIRWEQPSYYDISRWEDTEDPHYKADRFPQYVDQTATYFEELADSLVDAVVNPDIEEASDW